MKNFPIIPLFASIIVVAIFGTTAFSQNQKQISSQNKNQILQQKINDLENQISKNNSSSNIQSNSSQVQNPTQIESSKNQIKPVVKSLKTITTSRNQQNINSQIENSSNIQTNLQAASIKISGLSTFQVNIDQNDTAFSATQKAAQKYNFEMQYKNFPGMGNYITCLGSVCEHDNYFWAFYYNGSQSPVGASSQIVKNGDVVEWKFESW